MNDFETLDGLASEIVSDYRGPSDTNASDESHSTNSNFKSKRGRKSKSNSRIAVDSESIDTSGTDANAPVYEEMGAVMATTFISTCMIFGGEDFRPDAGEPEAMAGAWAAYFQAKGYNQFSPEVMLVMVTGGYVAKRLNMPNTQSRMKYYWEKFKVWRHARTNSRYYDQRQNNAGQAPSDQPAQ